MIKLNPKDWHYWGRWMEPPLSADFWMYWGEAKIMRKISSKKINCDVIYFNGHYYLWKRGYQSLIEESYKVAKRGDHDYLNSFIRVCERISKQILESEYYLKNKKEIFSVKELGEFFNLFQELFGPWMAVFPIAVGIEKYFEEQLHRFRVSFSDVAPVLQSGPQPWGNIQHREAIGFIKQLARTNSLDILREKTKEVINILQKKHPDLLRAMNNHVSRFEWIRCHNFQIESFILGDLIIEMRNELKNYSPKSLKSQQISLPREIKVLAQWISLLAFWRFRLAEISGRIEFYLKPHLSRVAKKLGLTYQELLWFTKNEILEALRDDKKLDKKIIKTRKTGFGIIYLRREEKIIIGKSLTAFENLFEQKIENEKKLIKGTVGSTGYARGKTRVVFTHQDLKKFKEGEILVAPETTPDFVPIMKKAIAFVTDAGGLTSHAAIVAREMKKPCIIATKIATKVLKDGDLVEVDANKGVVKILNK